MSLIWHDEVMEDRVLVTPERVTLGSRCARRFPWLHAFLTVVVDALLSAQMVMVPILPDWLGASCLLAANLFVWFRIFSRWRTSGQDTFVVPDLSLPPGFTIIRPGNRGYLLTLGEHLRGTIYIGGHQHEVSELVRRDATAGGFYATSIGIRDWGVIELDDGGHHKLFFQFVEAEVPPPIISEAALIGGAVYTVLVIVAGFWLRYRGVSFEHAVALACSLEGLALLFWAWDNESRAGLAFATVLHLALLILSFQLYDGENPFVWPGPRSLAGNYLVTRLDTEEPPEPKPVPTVSGKVQGAAAATKDPAKNTATKGDEGHQGGKGDTERARDPNARDAPVEAPKVELLTENNRKVYQALIDVDRNLQTSLNKFNVLKGDKPTSGSLGFGTGTGTGVGPGVGTGTRGDSKKGGSGGGGNVEGDFVSSGKIDTGANRPGGGNCKGGACGAGPKAINVAFSEPSGDFGGLTSEEIDRVVKARAGVFRACYQKELNHTPGIGGKLIIHFKIGGDGSVQAGNTAKAGGSTLSNDTVEQCIKSNVNRLKFPAKGGIANVNYPFVFTQGG